MGGAVTAGSSLNALDDAEAANTKGTAIQTAALELKGKEEATAYEFEAEQYGIQAQTIRTGAAQAEATRRDNLTSSLETIQAITAGRNVGGLSPTVRAITGNLRADTMDDILTERATYKTKEAQSLALSQRSMEKAAYSLLTADYAVAAAEAEGEAKSAEIAGKKTAVISGAIDSAINFGTKMFSLAGSK